MKRLVMIVLVLLAGAGICTADQKPAQAGESWNDAQKFSYVMGLDVAAALKKGLNTKIDMQVFIQGVEDGFAEKPPLLTSGEMATVKKRIADTEKQGWEQQLKETAKKNLATGELFLAENGKKPGMVTTNSGLQYEVLRKGQGPIPKAEDRVTVHYRAKKIDGTEFDNSYSRNKPALIPVNAVMAGWSEALQLMPTGSLYRLFLPPHLAYGERQAGARGEIKPNETLIFEVDLLAIEQPKADK